MLPAKQEDLIDGRILKLFLEKLTEYGDGLTKNKVPDGCDDSDPHYNYAVGRGIISTCNRLRKAMDQGELDPSRASGKFDPKFDASNKDTCMRKITILNEAE